MFTLIGPVKTKHKISIFPEVAFVDLLLFQKCWLCSPEIYQIKGALE